MADTIHDMLAAHNPAPRWTEAELVQWVQNQDEPFRTRILDGLKEAQARGLNTLRILHNVREQYEASRPGFLDIILGAMGGYLEGVALVHGPAAIRNLANGGGE